MRVLTECVAATSVVATLGLLCWAAWSDVAVRLIPNAACVSVAVFGLVHRATAGLEAVLLSSGVALGVFVLLVVMHARGLLGGGDVKLMAAVVLGFAPASALRFFVATAMFGGALALVHLALRRVFAPRPWLFLSQDVSARRGRCRGIWRRVAAAEVWRIRRHGSLPYGVAIAGGGAWVLLTGAGG